MSRHAKLGGGLTVWADGVDLGPPENKTVAVLLIGLLARGSSWSSREELAVLLYPDSDPTSRRASLRQALLRLRRWVGAEGVQEARDRVRLAPGEWTFDLDVEGGGKAASPMIAPGLAHPWLESIRDDWAPHRSEADLDAAREFALAVEAVGRADPETARKLLVGGAQLTAHLSVDTVGTLLGLTEPKERGEPLAFEHGDMRRSLYERLGCLGEARKAALRVYRLAVQHRRPSQMTAAGASVMFVEIEDGRLSEAAAWIDHLDARLGTDTRSLLFLNAKASYLWNMHRLGEAVEAMKLGIACCRSVDRATRLHFWTNFAVLCAEAREIELGRDVLAEARELAIPGLDDPTALTHDLAEGTQLMYAGEQERAVALFESGRLEAERLGFVLHLWYSTEAKAEALALAGRAAEARRVWSTVQAHRLSMCSCLTPRLAARRDRVLQAC